MGDDHWEDLRHRSRAPSVDRRTNRRPVNLYFVLVRRRTMYREAQIPVPGSTVETVALGTRLRPDFPRGFVTVYDRSDTTVQFQYSATPIL